MCAISNSFPAHFRLVSTPDQTTLTATAIAPYPALMVETLLEPPEVKPLKGRPGFCNPDIAKAAHAKGLRVRQDKKAPSLSKLDSKRRVNQAALLAGMIVEKLCEKISKLSVVTRDDAQSGFAAIKALMETEQQLRILRGDPLPGSRRPGPTPEKAVRKSRRTNKGPRPAPQPVVKPPENGAACATTGSGQGLETH